MMNRVSVSGLFLLTLFLPVFCNGATAVEDTSKPRLVIQLGHADVVTSVVFSPDGRYALSGSQDNTLKLWDINTGAEVRTFRGHSQSVTSVALSPDGMYALSGSEDRTLKLWDISTGAEVRTFKGHSESVTSVAFSPDSRYALSGSEDTTLKLWDIGTGAEVRTFKGHSKPVSSVAISHDGRYALSGSKDRTLKLWDIGTGAEVRTFTGHSAGVTSVAFSPDGRQALSGSWDDTLKLWDINTGGEVRTFIEYLHGIYSVAFSPDGRYALSGSNDERSYVNALKLWDINTGVEVWTTFGGHSSSVTSVAFSPDGRYALSGSEDKTLKLWDISTGKEVRTFTGSSSVTSVVFSPDGRSALSAGWDSLNLWDMSTGAEVRTFTDLGLVASVAISPDGRYALSGGSGLKATLQLWDISTGAEVRTFKGHFLKSVTSVAISPDGRYALSGSDDTTLKLWDTSTGAEVRSFKGHSEPVSAVAFSPDGRYALSGSEDTTLKLWDISTGADVWTFAGHAREVTSVAFSPDGKYALSGHYKLLTLWDISTGAEVRTFRGPSRVTSAAFSPDGRYALSGSRDSLTLWDVSTGVEVRTFAGHAYQVTSVAFSPDGRYVLSGGQDGTSIIWDIKAGKWLAKLVSFRDRSWAVVDAYNRYDASNGGDVQGLRWVVGNTPIELAQLKERYYEPGLLAKIVGYNKEPLKPVQAFDSPRLFPEVAVSESGKNKIKIDLTDQGGGIGKVLVLLNGKEIVADARGPKPDPKAKKASYKVDIPSSLLIPDQENKIEVMAWNAEGYLRSRVAVLMIKGPDPEKPAFTRKKEMPTLHAIVMGVSDYASPALHLTFASKDAADMAHAITISAKRLFGTDKVKMTLLTDLPGAEGAQQPTRENLKKAFETARAARSTDILVVYLSGHGVMSPGEDSDYYYLTKDARSMDLSDPAVRNAYGVSSAELTEWIKQIPALKQVLVLDTCAAGGAAKKLVEARGLSSDQVRALERFKDRTGFHVLMGASADAVSWEASQFGQGLLTYSLLQGMRGAALKEDAFVDVQKLFNYAADTVPTLARSIGGIQRPVIAAPRGTSFDIGLLQKEDKALIPLAAERPLVLRAAFQAEDDPIDSIELGKYVNKALRDASATAKGGAIVFVDGDELPGAYMLGGRYDVAGDKVSVKVSVYRDRKKQAQFTMEGRTDDLGALAQGMVVRAGDELLKTATK